MMLGLSIGLYDGTVSMLDPLERRDFPPSKFPLSLCRRRFASLLSSYSAAALAQNSQYKKPLHGFTATCTY
jgi:hypothetical protein